MILEQLEKAEIWVDREMRSLQPRVIILLDVFMKGSDEKVVRISGLCPEGKNDAP